MSLTRSSSLDDAAAVVTSWLGKLRLWFSELFYRHTPVFIRLKRASERLSARLSSEGCEDLLQGLHEEGDAEILREDTGHWLPSRISEQDVVVTQDVFDAWLSVPAFLAMLEVLEISSSNPRELFDVLDADLSGELGFEELVFGLMNLRGPAEKSYTVASLLCVRVVQQMLRGLVVSQQENLSLVSAELRGLRASYEELSASWKQVDSVVLRCSTSC